ncbi:GntR family transcriptional regulator [Paracoccus zeaxanthinifaciens]|uniref:GntR family transcriptional regulator n=1 Tax=Paracoccus zeaxanthinifaciens TaxID=187400 RepID=UPI0003B49A20|nr:GntR family transcriptional regulator [Paracoccus zeaxanthinifaciens]
MSRQNQIMKSSVNAALDRLSAMRPGDPLGSEAELAAALGVSRTTTRAVLAHLRDSGLIRWEGRTKRLLRLPTPADRFDQGEVRPGAERARQDFLEWILRTDLPPGSVLPEAALARDLGIGRPILTALLAEFEGTGLIAREDRSSLRFRGFTKEYASEMFVMREMIEREAMRILTATPDHPALPRIAEMELLHIAMLARSDAAADAFPALDAQFHRLICHASGNRFFEEFGQRISIIVHYHYQWNKRDEAARNRAALREHLAVIQAILRGDGPRARALFDDHLATARRTLMASVQWG